MSNHKQLFHPIIFQIVPQLCTPYHQRSASVSFLQKLAVITTRRMINQVMQVIHLVRFNDGGHFQRPFQRVCRRTYRCNAADNFQIVFHHLFRPHINRSPHQQTLRVIPISPVSTKNQNKTSSIHALFLRIPLQQVFVLVQGKVCLHAKSLGVRFFLRE